MNYKVTHLGLILIIILCFKSLQQTVLKSSPTSSPSPNQVSFVPKHNHEMFNNTVV